MTQVSNIKRYKTPNAEDARIAREAYEDVMARVKAGERLNTATLRYGMYEQFFLNCLPVEKRVRLERMKPLIDKPRKYHEAERRRWMQIHQLRDHYGAKARDHINALPAEVALIIRLCAASNEVEAADIVLPTRNTLVLKPRSMAVYVLNKIMKIPLTHCARMVCIKGQDHSTMINACKVAEQYCIQDDAYNDSLTVICRTARDLMATKEAAAHPVPKYTSLHLRCA